MNPARRHFLKMAGYGLGGTALTYMMEKLALSTAIAQPPPVGNYKALVCIFLNGGNDAHNMVIPITTPYSGINYTNYYNIRNPNGLAIAQSSLNNTMIHPSTTSYGTWALHPQFGNTSGGNPLYPLFGQGHLAVLANVGPLAFPMTRTTYQNGSVPKPYQLFSHSDQQTSWQNSLADRRSASGWGGRLADLIPSGNPSLPTNISVAGFPTFIAGASSTPLVVSPAPTNLNALLSLSNFSNNADDQMRKGALVYFTSIDNGNYLVNSANSITSQTLGLQAAFNVSNPTFTTVFPNTTLGNQLLQVARIIKLFTGSAPPLTGVSRQIFFLNLGGFDTHNNEISGHNNLYLQMSQGMRAFYDATVELGLANQVTTFTMSDFGRTLAPTGSGGSVGSDHAWGSHHLILGGAVRGNNFYGKARDMNNPVTIFPDLVLNGPSDADSGGGARGRFVPTVSVDQYAATLAKWFGLSAPGDFATVFPNLSRFSGSDLGFLNAT